MSVSEAEYARVCRDLEIARGELAQARCDLEGVRVAERKVWASTAIPLRELGVLHRPTGDLVLRRYRLFEPLNLPANVPEGTTVRTDTRWVVDRAQAGLLRDLAGSSHTLRAIVHGCTVEVEERRDASGHGYRLLRLTGVPIPEPVGG